MKWNHKGVEISLIESNADFTATVNGKKIFAASLDAMKGKLNKLAAVETFEIIRDGYGKIEVGKIVDVKRGQFLDEKGREYYSVIRNTPENMAAVKNYWRINKANDVKIRALKEEMESARNAIQMERAS